MTGDTRTWDRKTLRSSVQNIDNGAGVTVDEVLLRSPHQVVPIAVRIVYEDVTSGTAAAANYKLGITVGGTELMASTALENSKAVGTATAGVLTATYSDTSPIPANTPICCRYTGVATTVLGACHLEFDYKLQVI